MKPYYISGHGRELESTMTIPENCIVILKMHSGEISYKRDFDKICTLPLHVLQNPLDHTSEIIKTFGSVAIYTAGDECPDFVYHLVGCYGKPYQRCEFYGSGILDLTQMLHDDVCRKHVPDNLVYFDALDPTLSYDGIIDAITYLYRFSVDPTESYIHETLDSAEAREEIMALATPDLTMIEKCNLCIDYLVRHGHIVRKQSDLPGQTVFYNFICRAKEDATELYGSPTWSNMRAPFKAPTSFRVKNTTRRAKIVRARIAEAELKRKPLLRRYYRKRSTSGRRRSQK